MNDSKGYDTNRLPPEFMWYLLTFPSCTRFALTRHSFFQLGAALLSAFFADVLRMPSAEGVDGRLPTANAEPSCSSGQMGNGLPCK